MYVYAFSSREISALDPQLPVNPVAPAGQNAVGLGMDINQADGASLKPLDCLINEEYKVNCQWDGDQVYVPFDFLEKYFEVLFSIVK